MALAANRPVRLPPFSALRAWAGLPPDLTPAMAGMPPPWAGGAVQAPQQSHATAWGGPEMATRDYVVHMPPDRWIKTVCEQVNCDNWRYGWDSQMDESDKLGRAQAEYIRTKSGRTFTEMKGPNGTTVFRFEPGQRCFAEHRTRPATLAVASAGRVLRAHASLANLAEDYTEHVGRLADQYGRS